MGRNENGDRLVKVCAERELFLANTYFDSAVGSHLDLVMELEVWSVVPPPLTACLPR